MFKASEIHRLASLTESFFSEVKDITLEDLLKMDQSARIKVVRSMDVLKDKPILTKRVFEGMAMIKWIESHGGKVRNQELKALEKVFPFRDVQAAISSALQAYNKKIGYDPISMTQKESRIEERMTTPASGFANYQQTRGAKPSFKSRMKPEDEKLLAVLKAKLLSTPLKDKQKIMDQIQSIQSKYESKSFHEGSDKIRSALVSAITQYDKKQLSKAKWHNPNALNLYLDAVDATMADFEKTKDLEKSLRRNFNDRLLDWMLKAAKPYLIGEQFVVKKNPNGSVLYLKDSKGNLSVPPKGFDKMYPNEFTAQDAKRKLEKKLGLDKDLDESKGKWAKLAESHFNIKPTPRTLFCESRIDEGLEQLSSDQLAVLSYFFMQGRDPIVSSKDIERLGKKPALKALAELVKLGIVIESNGASGYSSTNDYFKLNSNSSFWGSIIANARLANLGSKASSLSQLKKRIELSRSNEQTESLNEGGPGSGGQYPTRKLKMPMSPFISVGTRKGILKNMPFDLEDVPLAKITHVAQAKFVPQKVKNLCKNPEVITKYPVCLLKIPSQDCYHVMDGHHRFLAAQKLGIENLPAKVWLKYEEEPAPAETPSEQPEAVQELLPIDASPEGENPAAAADPAPSEAMPLPEPEDPPQPNPEMLAPDDSANAMSEVPSEVPGPDSTAPDIAIVGVPGEHDHYEVMCEKCNKVTESCGCMAEEKAKRTTVCETCKTMSFIESKKLPMSLKDALKVLGSKGSF